MRHDDDRAPRARDDRFSDARKALFLAALRHKGSVLASCRLTGVSNRTAYNHRRDDPPFAEAWVLAKAVSSAPLELHLYQRAVEGVEEPVYAYGKLCGVRRRPSDALLVRMLAAEKPETYGRSAPAAAQARLAGKIERLARRLETLEAQRDSRADANASQCDGAVNVVNPLRRAAGPRARRPRRGGSVPGWRLSAARRRAGGAENPEIPLQP
jgi:hypothetical protein